MLIPDRLWEQMTDAEQQMVKETINGHRRAGKEITCPHCNQTIRIGVTYSVVAKDDVDPGDAVIQKKPTRHPEDARFLEAAKASGLFDAFTSAVAAEKEHAGVPLDMDDYFLGFWITATPVLVSPILLAAWIEEFGGRIEVRTGGPERSVYAVLSDGELRAFVPARLTKAATVTGAGVRPRVSTSAALELWTKGRFGYVPTKAKGFGKALRQRNVGSFGALVQ